MPAWAARPGWICPPARTSSGPSIRRPPSSYGRRGTPGAQAGLNPPLAIAGAGHNDWPALVDDGQLHGPHRSGLLAGPVAQGDAVARQAKVLGVVVDGPQVLHREFLDDRRSRHDRNRLTDERRRLYGSLRYLSFLFLISGLAALIYQIVWQRVLYAAFGVNIESITIIVSIFMLGLGLGSLVGGLLALILASEGELVWAAGVVVLCGILDSLGLPGGSGHLGLQRSPGPGRPETGLLRRQAGRRGGHRLTAGRRDHHVRVGQRLVAIPTDHRGSTHAACCTKRGPNDWNSGRDAVVAHRATAAEGSGRCPCSPSAVARRGARFVGGWPP